MAQQPGPVQATTVYYRDYFSDNSKDVFNGDYTSILEPYAVPTANAMPAAEVRQLAFNCRAQDIPTAFLLQHNDDSKLHIYIQLDRFHPRAGLPATNWDSRSFIAKGELHHNSHIMVEFRDDYFNQTNIIRAPNVATINAAYAANVASNLLGPYTANDAGVDTIRARRSCFVPPAYVPLFLANPLSPREAWNVVYAQIVTDNREQMCLPLINYLRCCLTIPTAAIPDPCTAVVPPVAPLPDDILSNRRRTIIENDFPALNIQLVHLQQTQIAGQLGLLVTENRAARQAEAARRLLEKNKPPAQFLGPVGSIRLLRYCQIANATQFPTFWVEIARNPKSQHLHLLQWEINRIKDIVNEPDLNFIATAPLLESSKSLLWEMTHPDAVNTGLNVFGLADQPIADALSQQQLYEMLHGDGASPSLSDVAHLLKAKTGAPTMLYHARQQIRRFEILNKVLLGDNHPLCLNLNAFCNRMISTEGRLHMLQAEYMLLPTMLCKKIAVLTSNWYKNQVASAAPIPPPQFTTIFDDIDEEKHWQPVMSAAFLNALGLSSFHLSRPTPPPFPLPSPTFYPPTPPTVAPTATLSSALPSPTNPPPLQERVNNTTFTATLFQTYRDAPTSCRTIRNKIRNNELPPLPNSKVDNQPMCIAFHAKGMCNSNCGRKVDHVSYNDTEYAPLVSWCSSHFPLE